MFDIIYLRVTDTNLDGSASSTVHSVGSNWKEPEVLHTERYQIITEAEARTEHPAMFGITPPQSADSIDKQIAELQALRTPKK